MGKKKINVYSIERVAIYLSGVKDGKGDLLPLGTCMLEDLWDVVAYLGGDYRFTSERDWVAESKAEKWDELGEKISEILEGEGNLQDMGRDILVGIGEKALEAYGY